MPNLTIKVFLNTHFQQCEHPCSKMNYIETKRTRLPTGSLQKFNFCHTEKTNTQHITLLYIPDHNITYINSRFSYIYGQEQMHS